MARGEYMKEYAMENNPSELSKQAAPFLEKAKKLERKQKRIMVLVCKSPLTYKLVLKKRYNILKKEGRLNELYIKGYKGK